MSLEPWTGSLILAKTAIQSGSAALQLSDSVLGRLKLRRVIAQAEEQQLRCWLKEQLLILKWAGDVRVTEAAQAAVTRLWEDCQLAIERNPGASHYFIELRNRRSIAILRESGAH